MSMTDPTNTEQNINDECNECGFVNAHAGDCIFNPLNAPAEPPANVYEDPRVQELLKELGSMKIQIEQVSKTLKELDSLRREVTDLRKGVMYEKTKVVNDINEEFEKKKAAAIAEATEEYEAKFSSLTEKLNEANSQRSEFDYKLRTTKPKYDDLKKKYDKLLEDLAAKKELEEMSAKWKGIIESSIWQEVIHEYQMYGAKRMAAAGRALNADEMGLGKTLQTIVALQFTDPDYSGSPQESAVLWVTNKNAMLNTVDEFKKWYPERMVAVVQGTPNQREFVAEAAYNSGLVAICNYEALQTTPKLLEIPWLRVVTDEAHKFRNEGTKVFKNVREVARNSKGFFALSGTPFVNRASELWAILHMIDPIRWPNKFKFTNEYCYYGSDRIAPGMLDMLMKQISKFTFRRTKEEVKLELPDLMRQVHKVDMYEEQRELYDQVKEQFTLALEGESGEDIKQVINNALAWLMRLRQVALWPPSINVENPNPNLPPMKVTLDKSAKLDEAMDIIEELCPEEKVVVFCTINEPMKELVRRCNELGLNAVLVESKLPTHVQNEIITSFQEEDAPHVLLMNTRKAEAINLYRASHCIMLDLWWNEATMKQAEARLHRIGQKSAVTNHIVHAIESVDNFIAAKVEEKSQAFGQVFNREELRRALDEGMI